MPASTSRSRRGSPRWAVCTPTRRRHRDTGTGASDGRRHLPRSPAPGVVGRDGARSQRFHLGRGRGGVRRRIQGHRGLRQEVRRGARHRHADLGSGDRRRGGRGGPHGHAPRGGDAVHRLHLLRLRHAHQLRRHRALPRRSPTPIVVRGPCGGYVRGGPFHSQNPEAAFFHTPGLKIVYPATARDAKGLIKASIRDEDPVIYLEHKWLYRRIKEALPEGEVLTPIGEARLAREGKDLSIVTYGATVWKSLEAADQLAQDDGLAVEVLDLRTLLPMDDAAIMRTVQKTNKVLIVHEDTRTGG